MNPEIYREAISTRFAELGSGEMVGLIIGVAILVGPAYELVKLFRQHRALGAVAAFVLGILIVLAIAKLGAGDQSEPREVNGHYYAGGSR